MRDTVHDEGVEGWDNDGDPHPRATADVENGGAFSVIYPVQGAGGYQLYGISPVPVLDVRQEHPDFAHSIVFPRVGDIWRYRSIDRAEYDQTRAQVENGQFRFRQRDVEFSPSAFLADPQSVNDRLLEVLYT